MQLLVLLLQLGHLRVSALALLAARFEHSQFSSQLDVLLNGLLVILVEHFVPRDHTLFAFQHLVQVLELLRKKDRLVPHHGIDGV